MSIAALPKPYPISNGGLLCSGIFLSGILSFLAQSTPGSLLSIFLFFLLLIFFLDFFSFFFSKKKFHKIRLIVLGFFLYSCFSLFFHEHLTKTRVVHKSEHSILFAKKISSLFSKSSLPKELILVGEGLVLGSSQNLPKDIKERAREGGVLHLFAASGLHLGIFLGASLLLFKRLFWYSRSIPFLMALIVGFLYLYCLAFPVSFLRAYSFAVYSLLGTLFYKKVNPADTLAYSSATVAIFLPDDFLSVGFLLSFSAVFGIFYFKPVFDRIFFANWRHLIKDNITLSLSCCFATFPVLVYYFHSFSFGSFWINLLIVPIASLLLPIIYLTLLIELVFGGVFATLLWSFSDVGLRILMAMVRLTTDHISYYFQWKDIPLPVTIYFSLICLIILYYYFFEKKSIKLRFPKVYYAGLIALATFVLLFHPFGIWIFSHQLGEINRVQSWFKKGNFLFLREDAFYILGSCYTNSGIKKQEGTMALSRIKRIFIEHENCLPIALTLSHKIRRAGFSDHLIITSNEKVKAWKIDNTDLGKRLLAEKGSFFLVPESTLESLPALIRYDGDKKRLGLLIDSLRVFEKKMKLNPNAKMGYIVMDFPPWSKEKSEDWKKFQKLLGISSFWEIVSIEDLIAGTIHHTKGDPNISFH